MVFFGSSERRLTKGKNGQVTSKDERGCRDTGETSRGINAVSHERDVGICGDGLETEALL